MSAASHLAPTGPIKGQYAEAFSFVELNFVLFLAFCMLAIVFDVWAEMAGSCLTVMFSPCAGLAFLGGGGLAIRRHMLIGVESRERLGEVSGQRTAVTDADLFGDDQADHALSIDHAIRKERKRVIGEIYDMIGSRLVAALASAERDGGSNRTAILALQSALVDLRITIGSLQPPEDNVAALLAKLRCRYELELPKSGIVIEWTVQDGVELEWLGAQDALHLLRIVQETISNSLGHGKATQIRLDCERACLLGKPGLRIEVTDNGSGFDVRAATMGRGRKNMVQRAQALGGKLDLLSSPDNGTRTTLWLPLLRRGSDGVTTGPPLLTRAWDLDPGQGTTANTESRAGKSGATRLPPSPNNWSCLGQPFPVRTP